MPDTEKYASSSYIFFTSLISGGVAGLVVDISLFPIDTVKTRLQSEKGFWRSGGFRGVYNGLTPTAAGSVPTAALFFCVYDGFKLFLENNKIFKKNSPFAHMCSASLGELVACLIRVPIEIAKQRRQVLGLTKNLSALDILVNAYKTEGLFKGLYRGFGTTVLREVPFSLIQFPLWEFFKLHLKNSNNTEPSSLYVSACGALAGGIAAGITTPLDLAKTRIMLAEQTGQKLNIGSVLKFVYREKGIKGLFAGFIPRVLWITIGGAIFFGVYDLSSKMLSPDERNM